MKIVTASASGIVIQMPATPISFGRINMNTATRIKERIDEINAEIHVDGFIAHDVLVLLGNAGHLVAAA